MRLAANASVLLVVDVHVRLAPAVSNPKQVIGRCRALIQAARRLAVPILVSEHCPAQLGPTVPELRELVTGEEIVAKTHFSCADEAAIAAHLLALGRRQIVVAGMEAHVCVLQSALGLAELGYQVAVVGDAVGSRTAESRATALARLGRNGVDEVTTEMVIFEWLHRADRPEFRELLALVK